MLSHRREGLRGLLYDRPGVRQVKVQGADAELFVREVQGFLLLGWLPGECAVGFG